MVTQAIRRRAALIGFAASFLLAGAAPAAELQVVSSGGGLAALEALAGELEGQTGHKLVVDFAPSMGTTPGAVPQRLARGENLDGILMVGYALDKLVAEGKVTDPVDVFISIRCRCKARRLGAGHQLGRGPAANDAGGAHDRGIRQCERGLHPGRDAEEAWHRRPGSERIRVVQADPVRQPVAKGDADLGFQQISELKPVHGIVLFNPSPMRCRNHSLQGGSGRDEPQQRCGSGTRALSGLARSGGCAGAERVGADTYETLKGQGELARLPLGPFG